MSDPMTGTRLDYRALLREHPGLTVSLAYAGISLIGLLFSWALFAEFGINVFHYAEISDFLLSALREPLTFVLAGTAWLAVALLVRAERAWFKHHPPKNWLVRKYASFSGWLFRNDLTFAVAFAAYAYLFLSIYAQWMSQEIKEGRGRQVRVELATDYASQGSYTLLGTTNKFVFLYDRYAEETQIVPHESILRLILSAPEQSPKP